MDIKIYGPPGTGKTTFLLQRIEEALKVYAPEEIAFVSFTRKGAYEGALRAKQRLGISPSRMQYFKTIHALCFAQLGLRKSQVLVRKHYRQFSEAVGFNFLGFYSEELRSNDDKYLFTAQMAHNNPALCKTLIDELDASKLWFIAHNYHRYKQTMGLMDYTDMLTEYVKRGSALPVKIAFVDEAQDLTPLQWNVVNKMFSGCDTVYIAGDDDQSIYEWAGADTRTFLHRGDKVHVLNQSHRVPVAVHSLASGMLNCITERAEKLYNPRQEQGLVDRVTDWNTIDYTEYADTLVLARNRCFLKKAVAALRAQGILYWDKDKPSVDSKVFNAIQAYEAFRRSPGDAEAEHHAKLYADYFVTLTSSEPWYNIMSINADDVAYYRALLSRGVTKDDKPTVRVSTIHASKGAEADHVVLALDMTERVHRHYTYASDSEWRCLYVGATRTKQKLTLKLQDGRYGYPIPVSQGD